MMARVDHVGLLAVLLGAGACTRIAIDMSQRELIVDHVDTIAFDVDVGSVEVLAFDRNGVNMLFHLVGWNDDVGTLGHELVDRRLDVVSECEPGGFCSVDWNVEIAEETAIDVRAGSGDVRIVGGIAPVTVIAEGGALDGTDLRSPTLDAEIAAGDVSLEYLAPPSSIALDVGEGAVAITLPAGSYRCELDTADGELDTTTVLCDDAASSVVHVEVDRGDITLIAGVLP